MEASTRENGTLTHEGSESDAARLNVLTGALMLSLFLAATETTFVTTAMPTIVAQLGGLATFSWVFSGFMLSSTASIAVFGKFSDLFGRRRIYLAAMTVFLLGSLACGSARTMTELIVYRIVQGIGAGGVMPLVFAIIGDVYSFEQRAKVQGLFASVWGISSILGPVVGGFLVDGLSWRWVFLLNVPLGILSTVVLLLVWEDTNARTRGRIDYAGAVLLVSAVVSLLLALVAAERKGSLASPSTWALAALAIALSTALWRVERVAVDPVIPVRLFKERLFVSACGHAFASGFAVFGSLMFTPLFVQFGSGVGATKAGAALIPLLLPWVASTNVSSRMILRFRYRSVALVGVGFIVCGLAGLALAGIDSPRSIFILNSALTGIGMGLSSPVFLIAVQTSLPRASLGSATSTLQLCRSIGSATGVTSMGAIFAYLVGADIDRHDLAIAARAIYGVASVAALGAAVFTVVAPSERLRGRTAKLSPAADI